MSAIACSSSLSIFSAGRDAGIGDGVGPGADVAPSGKTDVAEQPAKDKETNIMAVSINFIICTATKAPKSRAKQTFCNRWASRIAGVNYINVITSTLQFETRGGNVSVLSTKNNADRLFGHMKQFFDRGAAFVLVFAFLTSPVWATCGGGGGGGGGGMSGSGGNRSDNANPVVYHVPWNLPAKMAAKPVTEGLVLYWFPASAKELTVSPLK